MTPRTAPVLRELAPRAHPGSEARSGRAGSNSATLELAADEAALWLARLDEPAPETEVALRSLLAPDELERGARFYFERDRRRFAIGRGILRSILGAYAGADPRALRFAAGENGKPCLVPASATGAASAAPDLFFNVTHSEGLAAIAVTRGGEIGVDIESEREIPEWETIAATYFTPPEQARLQACTAESRRAEFFRAWTRQEALLKAAGVGLGGAVGRGAAFARRELPGLPARSSSTADFVLAGIDLAPGFAGALALPPAVRRATSFLWRDADVGGPSASEHRGRPLALHFIQQGPDFP